MYTDTYEELQTWNLNAKRDFSSIFLLTDEETEEQKHQMTCPRSHSKFLLLEIRT